MWIGVVSLFPDMFSAIKDNGVTGRAVKNNLLSIQCWDPRDFTIDKHRTVDDRPYGGGPGMLMLARPLSDAIIAAKQVAKEAGHEAKVIYLSPQGQRLDQQGVQVLSKSTALILVAGRYEGVDERVIENLIDEEWSVGDYVLSGGELPAMVLIDAIARFIPGVLGHALSAQQDSFSNGLLNCPHYTRPEVLDGTQVPSVLLSGDHEKIRLWRLAKSLQRTKKRRPDLLQKLKNNLALTDEQVKLLADLERNSY